MKTYDKFKKELTEDGMLHGEYGTEKPSTSCIMVPMILKLSEQRVIQ